MATTINNAKDKQQLIEQLKMIEHTSYLNIKLPDPIPIDKILHTCADAWNVDVESFKGKINHNNYKEKIMKISLLYGIDLFSETRHNDDILNNSFCYARTSMKGAPDHFIRQLSYGNFSETVFTFIQSLIMLAPNRFNEYIKLAKEKNEKQAASTGPTMKDYIQLLEEQNKFYREQALDWMNKYNKLLMGKMPQLSTGIPHLLITNPMPQTGKVIFKQSKRLFCVNAGVIHSGEDEWIGEGLELHENYTTSESIIDENGMLCYLIRELDGYRLAERFVEIKGPRKKNRFD